MGFVASEVARFRFTVRPDTCPLSARGHSPPRRPLPGVGKPPP
jgi:hypothetical protein